MFRCSSGFDRNRQDWVDLGCPDEVCIVLLPHRSQLQPVLHNGSSSAHQESSFLFQRKDPRCVLPANLTKAKSHSLTNATTPVSVSSTDLHGASGTSSTTLTRTSTATNPTTTTCSRVSTSTSQDPTSHPAEGEFLVLKHYSIPSIETCVVFQKA